ncbi:NUAK family SNF1-like kinase 1 [Platichthys flesus]|uniref:NUAK family SNF1-like kinase 1 n=1 Tax=Platichthys flesus TaxID=8260 RepID=UPI002DBD47D5|nr:NUAK family SNF1-like kinase 1 [Platichthys flesus]
MRLFTGNFSVTDRHFYSDPEVPAPDRCAQSAGRMGRREADSRGAMMTSDRSGLGCLQDAASRRHRAGEGSPRLGSQRPCSGEKTHRHPEMEAAGRAATASAPMEVKKHQHKHNLKHRYEVMQTLGQGTYGKVKKAVERSSLNTVAIKSIRKERITDDLDKIHIQREIEITSSLRHANIIRFHEVFESRDKIVIVMEYASRGELYDYIQERRRLAETEARSIFRQITSAVHYCHKNGVVHRDLKLENILLDQDFNVKLADFGLSNHFQRGTLLQTYCGSPLYAAPEIVKGLPYQGPEVDCWALGVLLYALVYSSMPFDGASHSMLTERISQGRYHRPSPPSDACALIDWLLTVSVDERATIEDVANHWWVNWGYEESVCDCPSSPHQECPSPLLARYIDWQNRVAAASNMAVDPGCLSSDSTCATQRSHHPFYLSLPLRSDRSGGRARGGMSSLRKSRKENAIPQTAQGACGGVCAAAALSALVSSTSTVERKKPKGILKPQRSFDSVFHSPPRDSSPSQLYNASPQPYRTHADVLSTSLPSPPTFSQPSSKMPKKGILKKLCGGESSYGSASGRRGSGAGVKENEAGDLCSYEKHSCLPASGESPTMHTEAVRRRKGILKRNGKFSRSLDLPDDHQSSPSVAPAMFPEVLQQLLRATGGAEGRRSRPSSVVSEDSVFSSDSFDLLDLSAQSRRRIFSRGTQRSSEEDLDQLRAETDRVEEGQKDRRKC